MKINLNLGQVKTVGHYGVRIGKTVLFEGCKAVVINTAKTIAMTGYEEGFASVKELGWNDLLSDKEARVYKKLKKMEKVSYLKAENAKLKQKMAKQGEDEEFDLGTEEGRNAMIRKVNEIKAECEAKVSEGV